MDPAALSLIGVLVGVGIAVVVAALSRPGHYPRWLRLKGVSQRLDVIRCDLNRMADYVGGLPESQPAVRQPFALGLAAAGGFHWNQAIAHFKEARAKAGAAQNYFLEPWAATLLLAVYALRALAGRFPALLAWRVAVSIGRPQILMKPSAAAWSNVSPSW